MRTKGMETMHFVAFAFLALKCIDLVSSAGDKETNLFHKYNEMYKQCRSQSDADRNIKLTDKQKENTDIVFSLSPRLKDFRDDLITEAICLEWIRRHHGLDDLKVALHMHYLSKHYSFTLMDKRFVYEEQEYENKKSSSEDEQFFDDLKTMGEVVGFFNMSSFTEAVSNIAQLRRVATSPYNNDELCQIDNDERELKAFNTKIKDMANKSIKKDPIAKVFIQMLTKTTSTPSGIPSASVEARPYKEILESTNSIFKRLLPGCDLPGLPIKESKFVNDLKKKYLLLNLSKSQVLNPSYDFRGSRIIKMMQVLMKSEHEAEIESASIESASAATTSAAPTSAASTSAESKIAPN